MKNPSNLSCNLCERFNTCVSVSCSDDENSALSAIVRYCFSRNFFSSASSWEVVKGVLGFLFGLCFLRVHLTGPGPGPGSLKSPATISTIRLKMSFHFMVENNAFVPTRVYQSISQIIYSINYERKLARFSISRRLVGS